MPEVFYLHLWGYGSSGSYSSHCRSSVASEWSEWFCRHVSHSQMDAGCIYLAAHPRQQVPSGKDGQEFHVLSPAYAISGSNGNATAPNQWTARHTCSRKWLQHQVWRLWYPLESLVGRQWAEPYHDTWSRYKLGWPLVDQWCNCSFCGSTAC